MVTIGVCGHTAHVPKPVRGARADPRLVDSLFALADRRAEFRGARRLPQRTHTIAMGRTVATVDAGKIPQLAARKQ
jgi:hypothetical protein